MLRRMGIKRATLLLMAGGYLGLLLDAWIGHQYSGSGITAPPQYFPLIFSPLAAVLLGVLGGWETSPRKLALGTGLVGGASVVMGLVGVGLHLVPVVGDLAKEEVLSFAVVMETLGSAPPLLAPGAYFAIGALVVALGSRRLRISVEEGSSQNPGLPTSAAEGAVLEQAA